ncbi:hypothetical protein SCUCBS95973_002878 [Sporothrix curviconia]|uniref:C2H2-type domain-containing protein n=1 Tax=Sporothrix curviconia TaxID=1260050 RepID=A0ABP0BAQ3_9PEZI
MARVPSETPPAVVCAENIALLHALHTVPMLPSKNDLGPVSRRKDGYLLSFEQERNLAGALAFLSGISDNASHVTAVCIEEDRGTESLRVLLAINKKTPNDGDAVLQTLKSGLESVLGPLVRAGLALDDGGTVAGQVTEVVFKAIVTMCQKRILCRLRLGKNFRNRPRQPFKSVLQQAVDALKRHHGTHGTKGERGTKALAAVDIPRIIATARTVMGLVDAWRQHQVPARLEELIHGVCRLKDMPGFCRVINDIPNRDMPPEARKNLVNIVQKVARYRGIARFLYRMARAVPVVRRMSVVLVKLAPSAFKKTLAGEGYAPDISSRIVQTCGPAGYSHQQLDNVYRSLQTTRAKATADFQDLARKVLKDAKIHAEIQLLAYCEQQAKSTGKTRSMPRVLRSNKDTCFLCNTFIKMRGNMHTSRYHGRLYPGWRLPATLSASVHHRFNEVLSDQIRSSLATLQTRKKKTQRNVRRLLL